MSGIHEMWTDHGERNAVAVLRWKLHTLLELVLKRWRVETTTPIVTSHTHSHTHIHQGCYEAEGKAEAKCYEAEAECYKAEARVD